MEYTPDKHRITNLQKDCKERTTHIHAHNSATSPKMTSPSPSTSATQPTSSTKAPRANLAYVRIDPPSGDFVLQPPNPSLPASKLELHKAVQVSKVKVATAEEGYQSQITRLTFLQDAFRRQNSEIIHHGRDCQKVLGKDVVLRNLFAEVEKASVFVNRAEYWLRSQEEKLRQDEVKLEWEEL